MKVTLESKGDFNKALSWLNKTSSAKPQVNKIANDGVASLSRNTPRDTGATASGWKATTTTNGTTTEIVWTNVAYPGMPVNVAKLIELGHGTRNGGYVPPRPYIRNAMKPVWGHIDHVVKEMVK